MPGKLIAYLATVGDAWVAGERLFFDSIAPTEVETEGYELRRFDLAATRDPDADLVVVLTEEPANQGPAGTARMRPFFEAWAAANRPLGIETVANSAEPAEQYAQQSTLLDGWMATYDEIRLFLGGADSITDALAWMSSLDGSRHPDHVRVAAFRDTILDETTLIELGVNAAVTRELTREHTVARMRQWEFLEAAALANLHDELHDVAPLLRAAATYLQRNDGDIRRLGLLPPVSPARAHTADLCHAVDIAEHLMTVQRREEELAWMVILASTELSPAAWAERRLPGPGSVHERVREWSRGYGDGFKREADRLLRFFGLHVGDNPMADTVRCLALHAAGPRLPVDVDAARAFVVWCAVRSGLKEHRDALAHLFHDLNADSLRNHLLVPAVRAARQRMHELLTTPVATDERVLLVDEVAAGRAARPPEGVGGPAARRLLHQVNSPERISPEQAHEMLHSLRSALADADAGGRTALAHVVHRLRERGHSAAVDDAMASARSVLQPVRALGLSDVEQDDLAALFHDEGLFVASLAEDRASPLRQLLSVFVDVADQPGNPLREVRRRVIDGLVDDRL